MAGKNGTLSQIPDKASMCTTTNPRVRETQGTEIERPIVWPPQRVPEKAHLCSAKDPGDQAHQQRCDQEVVFFISGHRQDVPESCDDDQEFLALSRKTTGMKSSGRDPENGVLHDGISGFADVANGFTGQQLASSTKAPRSMSGKQ